MRQIDKYKNRKPTSFTLSVDTLKRLNDYATYKHTNKSQALTDLIWAAEMGGSDYGNKIQKSE